MKGKGSVRGNKGIDKKGNATRYFGDNPAKGDGQNKRGTGRVNKKSGLV